MKYDELFVFITKKMRMAPGYNYQPVMIRTLLQNDGKATREQIEDQLKIENKHLLPWKKTDLPFQKLIEHSVCRYNDSTKEYELLDFDEIQTHAQWQAVLVTKCNERIKEVEDNQITWWIISAGRVDIRVETWNEFRDSNTVGFFWNDVGDLKKLSEDGIKEGFKKHDKDWGPGRDILKIKKDDIIFVKEGKVGFYGIARAIDTYQFSTKQSYHHTIPVEWITTEHIDTRGLKLKLHLDSTLTRIHRKEEVRKYYERAINGNYFAITSQEVSKYDDEEGKQYHFPLHIPNAKKFVKGTNFVVQRKIKGQYYFMGYGKVGAVRNEQESNEKGKQVTMGTATYSKYTEFNPQKLRTEKVGNKFDKIAFPGGKPNIRPAMLEIPYSLYREIIGGDLIEDDQGSDTLELESFKHALDWKPNLVLYGPPGTGKTWNATKIAEQKAGSIPKNKKRTWKSLAALVLLENNGEPMNYGKITELALKKNLVETRGETPHETIAKDMRNDMDKRQDDSIFVKSEDGVYGLNIPTTFAKAAEMILFAENKAMHSDKITEIALEKNLIKQKEKAGATPTRSMNQILSQDVKNNGSDSKFVNVGKATYALRSQISDENESLIYKVTFHPSYSYEDFVEGYRPVVEDNSSKQYELKKGIFWNVCEKARDFPDETVVLIIDEINRGNIPKIFGELITLIEEDKRGEEKYALTLAYSQDSFFVPKNLLIIGTMNTADKSLMQMDDALKRRFVFEELMPDTEALREEFDRNGVSDGEKYAKILEKINEKIIGKGEEDKKQRKIQFRDKQIGHSYFWFVKSDEHLQNVIKYDIIPLLQDYFYGDYDEIRKVLGKKIIGDDNRPTSLVSQRDKAGNLKDELLRI